MEQHHLPLAQLIAGHQRRAVGQRGNGALRQIGVGLGHDLAGDADIAGHRQAKERAVAGEGAERFGLPPGHGPADGAPARAQAHGHQRVGAFEICGGRAGARETDQQAALVDPIDQQVGFRFAERRNVSQQQHVGAGQQHVFERAVDQVSRRHQRAAQIVERRQQVLRLLAVAGGQQPHFAALQRVIGQRHGPGGARAFNLKAADAVAQLGGQREGHVGLRFPGAEAGDAAREFLLQPVGVGAEGDQRQLARAVGRRADRGDGDVAAFKAGGFQCKNRALRLDHPQGAFGLEQRRDGVAGGVVQPVGEPDSVETCALSEGFERVRHIRRGGEGGGLQARQLGDQRVGGREGQIPSRQLGQAQDGHGTRVARSLCQ